MGVVTPRSTMGKMKDGQPLSAEEVQFFMGNMSRAALIQRLLKPPVQSA